MKNQKKILVATEPALGATLYEKLRCEHITSIITCSAEYVLENILTKKEIDCIIITIDFAGRDNGVYLMNKLCLNEKTKIIFLAPDLSDKTFEKCKHPQAKMIMLPLNESSYQTIKDIVAG